MERKPISEVSAKLNAEYRSVKRAILMILPLLGAAAVFAFINRYVTLVLLAVTVLYHLFYSRKKQKEYTGHVNRENIRATTCRLLGSDTLHEKDGGKITRKTIESAGLMPVKADKGSPLLCWGIDGTLNGFAVSVCDATIAQDFTLVKRGKKRVHFNSGAWVRITLPEDTGKRYCILEETSVPTPIRMEYFKNRLNMELTDLEEEKLIGRCALYQPRDREQQMSTRAQYEFAKLLDYTTGYPAMSVNGDHVDFFLRGRFLAMPVSVTDAPTENSISFDPLPELSYLIKIAKAI